jgi:hypothetical protein
MSRPSRLALSARLGAALLAAAVAVSACALEPVESFDPTGPCTHDGAAEGAYPELEARVPETYEGAPPERLDSGRNCTPENLGTLLDDGIEEIRFAGGTWQFGGDIAVVTAVFTAPGLTAEDLAEFYEMSARSAGRTQVTGESTRVIAGRQGYRLDTTTGERIQTVVVWPAADPDHVNVVISHNLPDPKIEVAVEAFGQG